MYSRCLPNFACPESSVPPYISPSKYIPGGTFGGAGTGLNVYTNASYMRTMVCARKSTDRGDRVRTHRTA